MDKKTPQLDELINSSIPMANKKAICLDLCSSSPDNAQAWCYLGYVCGKLGSFPESIKYLQKAIKIQPRYFDAFNCLGNTYIDMEGFSDAVVVFKYALAINPDHPGVLNNLGRALNFLGKKEAANACFRRALKSSPSYVPALINLGHALHEGMHHEEAIQCFERALLHTPDDTNIYNQIGSVYKNTGRFDQALSSYRKSLKIDPDDIYAIMGIAAVLEAQGNHYECHKLIISLTEEQRLNPVVAIIYSGLCHRFNDCEKALQLIDAILEQPGHDNWCKVQLNFSAGRIYDIMKNNDKAFRYYEKGNKLKRHNYNAEEIERLFSCVIQTFTRKKLAKLPHASTTSEKPVFIIGMPRSGTSLVEQILASHPDVHGAGELPYLGDIYPGFIKRFIPNYKEVDTMALTQEALDKISGSYLAELDRLGPDALRITDKMPYNFFRLGLIELLLPCATVIHCSRNAMDTCLSCYLHDFQGTHDYAYDLTSLGSYYRLYRQLMDHWRTETSLQLLDISYEELVSDTEVTTRKLIDFCGLEWNDNCLSFYENKRFVATSSKNQVNKPIYSSSIGRWRHYEKHLGPLVKALGEYANGTIDLDN